MLCRHCGKCSFVVYIPVGTKAVTCIKCRTYYCVKCSHKWHQGECDSTMDEGFRAWLESQDPSLVRPCPRCNTIIARNEGCKFMTCKSDKCQGKTFFCMCCYTVLASRHEPHPCTVDDNQYIGSRLKHNCRLM